jgi:pyridoxamine 5'-phosphate oxidase-like protein
MATKAVDGVGDRRSGSRSDSVVGGDAQVGGRLTSQQVWGVVRKASFAVLSYVTPSGEARSSGVVYRTSNHRMYVAVGPESWKARHISKSGRVAVTVLVRRGGLLSLVAPIPPATISFHGTAAVHRTDSAAVHEVLEELAPLLPEGGRTAGFIIEIEPQSPFLTYGIRVPLMKLRDPAIAQTRVAAMRPA